LYTGEQTIIERPDGSVDAIIKSGSPSTGERYGYLRYELGTAGGKQEILLKEAHARPGYESTSQELLLELAVEGEEQQHPLG